jgi:ABC-2 type transport system ATP-binding protein
LISSLANDDGLTIFISSHILKEVEAVATRVGIIQHGRMVAEGDVDELLNASGGLQIEVGSPDVSALRAAILELPGASVTGEGELGLIVTLDGLDGVALNKALVLQDIPVSYLGAGRDLEDVFLDLTKSQEIS